MAISTELIAELQLTCGEGPVWEPFSKTLYWTDSGGEAIFNYDSEGRKWKMLKEGTHAASLTLHASGGLMICGKNGFYHLKPDGTLRTVADTCEDNPICAVNDIIADPLGRIFGGQEAYKEDQPYEPGYLYKIDLDGTPTIVEEGLHNSNGMGFSPDLNTFYLIDTIPGNIYSYDFNLRSGEIKNKKVLIKLDQNEGLPDGMTVDKEGFIWIARWFGGGISRFDPSGKLERKINLPVAQPTSLTFGGEEWNEIFVTSAAAQWESPLAPANHNFKTPRGGGLYRITQEIVGKPEYLARV